MIFGALTPTPDKYTCLGVFEFGKPSREAHPIKRKEIYIERSRNKPPFGEKKTAINQT